MLFFVCFSVFECGLKKRIISSIIFFISSIYLLDQCAPPSSQTFKFSFNRINSKTLDKQKFVYFGIFILQRSHISKAQKAFDSIRGGVRQFSEYLFWNSISLRNSSTLYTSYLVMSCQVFLFGDKHNNRVERQTDIVSRQRGFDTENFLKLNHNYIKLKTLNVTRTIIILNNCQVFCLIQSLFNIHFLRLNLSFNLLSFCHFLSLLHLLNRFESFR